LSAEGTDASDGVVGHGELGPPVPKKAPSGRKGHEIMATLLIPGRAETNSTNRARQHVIGVFFVSLDISAEFKPNMFVIIEMLASEEIPGRKSVRYAVGVRKCIKPEDSVGDKPNQHKTRDALERKGVVPAASPILDRTNVAFDVGNVFVLGTEVEANGLESSLKGLELGISQNGRDAKATTMVHLKHTFQTIGDSGNLAIGKVLDCAKMQPPGGGDQKRNLVHEHDVDGQNDLLKPFEQSLRL
jgi:hypothetical protein